MSDEDMPDLALGAPLAGEGAADDVLNEVDELENLLEDALDERFAKGAQAGPPGVEVIQAAEETGNLGWQFCCREAILVTAHTTPTH